MYRVLNGDLQNDRNKLILGRREYELVNHLGNVLATVSDVKLPAARVLSHTDYYAFGSAMPGRSGGAYRYGFNGKEKADEVSAGNLDFGARIYNPNIGRWLSVDPLAAKYPFASTYNFALNSPIQLIDPDGARVFHYSADEANRTIKNLNAIFRAKYKIDYDVFEVETKQASITRMRDWWDFLFGASTKIETVSYIKIKADTKFNFFQDEKTIAMKASLEANVDVYAEVTDKVLDSKGLTKTSQHFQVPPSLPDFAMDDDPNTPDITTETYGGAWLHELLYHISPLGKVMMDAKPLHSTGASDELYQYFLDFGIKNNHAPGDEQSPTITAFFEVLMEYKKKLNEQKKQEEKNKEKDNRNLKNKKKNG